MAAGDSGCSNLVSEIVVVSSECWVPTSSVVGAWLIQRDGHDDTFPALINIYGLKRLLTGLFMTSAPRFSGQVRRDRGETGAPTHDLRWEPRFVSPPDQF